MRLATESTIKVLDPNLPDPDTNLSAFDARCEELSNELDLGLRAVAANMRMKFGVVIDIDGDVLS